MPDLSFLERARAWVEAHVLTAPELAAFGFAAAIVALLALIVLAVNALVRALPQRGIDSERDIRRAADEPGYRILVGAFEGRRGREARGVVTEAMEAHLARFCFGALFRLFQVARPKRRAGQSVEEEMRERLKRTGADLVLWGVRESAEPDGLVIRGLSRGGRKPEEAVYFELRVPGHVSDYADTERQLVAYLLAKKLQPALSRPDAFRAERIAELAERLEGLIDAGMALPQALTWELEHDFSAMVLHLAQGEPHEDWIEKVITLRRASLDTLKSGTWVQPLIDARLDLGQAILKRAERRFDPVAVREATVHLNAVIESLRGHDVIRTVQKASEGLSRAQGLVETRRRFAVNFTA